MLSTTEYPIAGGTAGASAVQTRWICVSRPFRMGEKTLQPGDVLEVERTFAQEMVAYNKATFAEKPAPVVEPVAEAPAPPAPEARPEKARKGVKNAR